MISTEQRTKLLEKLTDGAELDDIIDIVYDKAIDEYAEALSKHSEFSRPVGWSNPNEIILMSTAKMLRLDLKEQNKRRHYG